MFSLAAQAGTKPAPTEVRIFMGAQRLEMVADMILSKIGSLRVVGRKFNLVGYQHDASTAFLTLSSSF